MLIAGVTKSHMDKRHQQLYIDPDISRLGRLGIATEEFLVSLKPNDIRSVLKVVNVVQKQKIYSLVGKNMWAFRLSSWWRS